MPPKREEGPSLGRDSGRRNEPEIAEVAYGHGLYSDPFPEIAAREYVGCFSVAQVRERLHQPPPPENTSLSYWQRMQVAAEIKRRAGVDPAEEMISVNSENHFRPGCACAKLHIRCGGSAVVAGSQAPRNPAQRQDIAVNYSLGELRDSAEAGCWFCSIIYGGIKACPQWDGNRAEITSLLTSWQIKTGSLQDPRCVVELFGQKDPELEFYTQLGGTVNTHYP
jgi:hypothetical protein